MLVVFANIDSDVTHNYGRKFRPTMDAIRKLFVHQYVHIATSLKAITKELGSADGVCNMKQAPSSSNLLGSNGTANAIDDVDDHVT